MAKIVICDPIAKVGIEKLKESGHDVHDLSDLPRDKLLSQIADADAIVVRSRTKVNKEFFEHAQSLKVIARSGVGLDNIDLNEAKNRNIKVVNAVESPAKAVAELTIALILSLTRNVALADHLMKKGQWAKKELAKKSHSVFGKTLAIIGYGRIGRRVATIARTLGMSVIAYDVVKLEGVEQVSFEEALKRGDIFSIHVPLLPATKHMFNEEVFNKMKNGAFIINTSRGAVIDQNALKKALDTGKVAGAALDVFEDEPNPDPELVNRPNVVATPHIGSSSIEAQKEITLETITNLLDALK